MEILNRWKAWSRKKKILWGVALAVLVLLAAAGARTYVRQKAQAAIRESFSQVETVQVSKQNLIDSISVTGTIASADSRDVQVIVKNAEDAREALHESDGLCSESVDDRDRIVCQLFRIYRSIFWILSGKQGCEAESDRGAAV